ncbi:MAG: hypothetical protein BMS9Abin11_0642 [Gammaproteobacteria bacterium]|nr:MAG: hypothetical protein BMS9Abin11_0642 [Gammaproteobacteria bacterium]
MNTILLLSIFFSALVYLPGINGPFVFDDHPNLLNNDYVKIRDLKPATLYRAAYSLKAGPLQRPVAMLSFAINYYFTGSFRKSFPYKATNLFIHALNGVFIFILLQLLFGYCSVKYPDALPGAPGKTTLSVLSAVIAMLWVMHPIQLTTVLYVVQRMTSLSAGFVLLALTSYLYGRLLYLRGKRHGLPILILGTTVFGILGLLSKENAVLLPVFILAIEFIVFPEEWPWTYWHKLSDRSRYLILAVLAILAVISLIWFVQFALGGYSKRDFTPTERLLTQPRVLFYYMSQIVAPRINELSLYHDDIAISRSLFTPWTTIPAIFGIIALLAGAIFLRKRLILISLGILWFFVGHSLESSILPLEMVHEHRNYLASLGIIIIMVYVVVWMYHRTKIRTLWLFLPMLLLVMGISTIVRSNQWSTYTSLFYIEALNKPRSARAQSGYAVALHTIGKYPESIIYSRRAALINPKEPGYYINMHLTAFAGKIKLSEDDVRKTLEGIKKYPKTILLSSALYKTHECLIQACAEMAPMMEQWMRILTKEYKYSLYQFMLGRALHVQGKDKEAIRVLEDSHRRDPIYLHPLFELAGLYLSRGKLDKAKETLARLKQANIGNLHPRDREIQQLSKQIERLQNKKARQRKKR